MNLQPGEIVDITIRGARVGWTVDTHSSYFLSVDGEERNFITPNVEGITVQRRIPADGEPKPGELWQDRLGCAYWVTKDGMGIGADGGQRGIRSIHAGELGPISRVWAPPSTEDVAAAILTPDADDLPAGD